LLFVTINDCPTLGNLPGKNKGFQARTYILDDTCNTYVRYNKKVVYLSHRQFLSPKYPLREEGIKHFEGVGVKRKKPCTMVIR
jgi:hypothetical protein